jgi:cold shock protein
MGGNNSRFGLDPELPKNIGSVMHCCPIGFASHHNGDQRVSSHSGNKAIREEERKMYPTRNNSVAFFLTFVAGDRYPCGLFEPSAESDQIPCCFGRSPGSKWLARSVECMAKGTVKWFNEKKGFGFIVDPEVPTDIFVHFSVIQADGFRTLNEGETVEYELYQDEKGAKARNVVRV